MSEKFYVGEPERFESEMQAEVIEVRDKDGNFRFSSVVTSLEKEGWRSLEEFIIQNETGDEFDILQGMQIEPGTVGLNYTRQQWDASASVDRVIVPRPDSALHTLIFVHELSHVAQAMEMPVATEGIRSHTRQVCYVLALLKNSGIELSESGIVEQVQHYDAQYAELLNLPEDDETRMQCLKQTNRAWSTFVEEHPVVVQLDKLYEPVIEQDAHRRTNELLYEAEQVLDISFDFLTDQDDDGRSYVASDGMYGRAYRILTLRKATQTFGAGLALMAMCKQLGIAIESNEVNDAVLQAHLESPEFQEALNALQKNIRGINSV